MTDRTMVGDSATRLGCEFQRTERRRHDEHETPTGRKRHGGRSLRGLQGRSATGLNGQAAKEESVGTMGEGAGCRKIFLAFRQVQVFFT